MELTARYRATQNLLQLCRNPRRVFRVRAHRYIFARAKRGDMENPIVLPPRLQELYWLFYLGGPSWPRLVYRRRY